ncbi:MAG TPA: glycosyltransferase family protein [Gemmataceae bacterium]|jgi:spore coat polysaccharide biosynthesis protein SpsF|nr:glycosyltransferase family protein [Gemmataceae bacterium]
MKTVAIIEARMSSIRLAGKVLRPILGKPMLELLVERLQRARRLDHILIATTTNPGDAAIAQLSRRLRIGCFRGSEDDVLDRVLQAARHAQADVIVEITGDCPLIDPDIVDQLVDVFQRNRFDYVSNNRERTYPLGLDTQVFSTKVLEEVARLTQDPVDHEHVSLYIYEHPERFALHNVPGALPEKYRDIRLTVDTAEDLALIAQIYESLYPANPAFTLREVLALFDRKPELREVNRGIQQKRVR